MKTVSGMFIALAVLFCCSPANGVSPGFFPFEPDEEMRGLVSRATALALIHDLSLTTDQREEIKQTLKPVHEDIELLKKEERSFRDEKIKPRLRQVIEDLKAGRDPTATRSEKNVEEMDAMRTRMTGLFQKTDQAYQAITALLTPAQQERLRDFRFSKYMGPFPAMHPARLHGMKPVELLNEIRNASQEEIDARVLEMGRIRDERRGASREGKRMERREQKIQSFMDLVQQIHDMPQAEFDAKKEQLKKELKALSPPRPGPGGDRGHRHRPKTTPFMGKGFDTKRIVFSQAFYESL